LAWLLVLQAQIHNLLQLDIGVRVSNSAEAENIGEEEKSKIAKAVKMAKHDIDWEN